MSISSLDAASAYNRVLSAAPATSSTPDDGAAASFGGMVESLVGEASGSLRQAETASAKQVAGKGDLVDVVTAIGAAETALNTVVAVRDRVVSAYTEIMHMQI
ncbi:MAG: flagellar hook-basal body complex protein FliE [Sphingomonas oligoaromativorans]|jgi:flagellar hook-basal body complex protein FliE|uniref:flagellar hook-basal body complex protein FliE n=1 Tax=Sphingomonas oligoaromativorans TaxID=575322 RepID=UPI0014205788|nr:flagellar hook-basal body complex protein FliE [Sphingomonas oligoaromativorans]NIJ34764.1 flagellar hook-basal body complex protein FliE [Sphingomonas oligoaromativorans]